MDTEVDMPAASLSGRGDFDTFFRDHFAGVARAAGLVVRDVGVGQELAQEGFARLFPRWSDMDSADHARNFVYRVAINLARSHMRRTLRLSVAARLNGSGGQVVTPDPAERSGDWLVISPALGMLSPRQRACVVLVDYADLDSATAGRILGMRAGTVRVHLTRGRRALRERLTEGSKETP
jgi:RNA polymerase sigma-70 factor (ECF subfamily)